MYKRPFRKKYVLIYIYIGIMQKKSLAFKVNSLFLDIIHIDGIVYNVHYRKNFFDHECVYQF